MQEIEEEKNLGGRPLKFTPEEMQAVIDDYFNTTKKSEWTISGLAIKIGSKQLIQDYEKREEYAEMIKKAKLMVENSYELSLRSKGGVHNIFALKNFGWRDKHEVKQEIDAKISIEWEDPEL